MTTKKKSQSSFRGKVASNAVRTGGSGTSYSHLRLPKGIPLFNPDAESIIKLDFLPYLVTNPKHPDRDTESGTAVEDSLWYRLPYRLHRNLGATGKESAVCLTSVGKKCPVCEAKASKIKAGQDKKDDDVKALNSSLRNLYIVIPKGSKKFEEEIHVFDISDWNFQKLLTKELKADPEKEIFPDLEEGLTLKVRFEPGELATSKPYPDANRIDFLERDEAYDESILEDVPNLDEILVVLSYKELESLFLELGDEEEDEEEEAPKRSKKTLSKHKKPLEEEEDEEEEEEEEEDEKPVKKSFKKKPIKKDDDDDEEDEEEDETPAPKKKKPSRRAPVEEEEEEEEEEDERPRKKSSTPKMKTTSHSNNNKKVCPHKLKFGVDTEKYDVCDTCEVWSDCVAEKERKER